MGIVGSKPRAAAWLLLAAVCAAPAGALADSSPIPNYAVDEDEVTLPLVDGVEPAVRVACEGDGPDFTKAIAAGRSGFVTVRWTVDLEGKVTAVRPEPWVKAEDLAPVQRWLATCRYRPARLKGAPMPQDLTASFGFSPEPKPAPDEPAPLDFSEDEPPARLTPPAGRACGAASFASLAGTGLVKFVVHRDGHVTDVESDELALSPETASRLETWLTNCPFTPAREGGKAVAVKWRLRKAPFPGLGPPLVIGSEGNLFVGPPGVGSPPVNTCTKAPSVPEQARALQLSGTVLVEYEVPATGEVGQTWRLGDAPPLLYRTVRQWLRACPMKPALLGGRPVRSRAVQLFVYRAPFKPGPKPDPQLPAETLRLKSGLVVLLSPARESPQVTLGLRFGHGVIHDPPGRYGLSHYAASAVHDAGRAVPGLPAALLSSPEGAAGACAVDLTQTICWETVAPRQIEAALRVERARLSGAEALPTGKWLAGTRAAVASMLLPRPPYWQTYRATYRSLFPEGHPLRAGAGGSEEEAAGATVAEVESLLRGRFTPANATLAIAGDFDPAAVHALVARLLDGEGSAAPAPAAALPPLPLLVTPSGAEEALVDPSAPGPRLDLVWRGIAATGSAAEGATADVLLELLADDPRARLRVALAKTRRVALTTAAFSSTDGQSGWLRVTVTPASGHAPEELLPLAEAEIERLRASGPTQAEVAWAIESRISDLRRRADTAEGLDNRARLLNEHHAAAGGPRTLAEVIAAYRAVTPSMVQALAMDRLASSERLVLFTQTAAPAKQ